MVNVRRDDSGSVSILGIVPKRTLAMMLPIFVLAVLIGGRIRDNRA